MPDPILNIEQISEEKSPAQINELPEEDQIIIKEIYRVRKSKNDIKSQIGTYDSLDKAKEVCNENGVEYSVFNLKGEIVYQIEPKQEDELKPSTDIITNDDENKMKYSDSKKPLICMQTQSTCYQETSNMIIKGVILHSTGGDNPNLKRFIQPSNNAIDKDEMLKLLGINECGNDWNHIHRQAGANCWIGKLADGSVTTVQTMPWNYKGWECSRGPKGSCNDGWIQIEICEDELTDKEYFEMIYNESCEIIAYLCKLYNINPYGTVIVNGVKIPTILCHEDAYKLGFASNYKDINHWFPKFGKSMDTIREKVAELLNVKSSIIKPVIKPKEIFRVRKAWEDAKSEIGVYNDLNMAKKACDDAEEGYEVYDSKGIAIYPEGTKEEICNEVEVDFKVGDTVQLLTGATFINGKSIPNWVFKSKLYVKEIRKNGNVVISSQKNGSATGIVSAKYLIECVTTIPTSSPSAFIPYLVRIDANTLDVRAGASTKQRITSQVEKGAIYTIIAENGKWGKLKNGAGWINLDYTNKV